MDLIDIYLVYDNLEDKDKLINANIDGVFYHFIDAGSLKGKSKAYKFKGTWSARLNPFIGLYRNGKMERGFYSETKEDIVELLKNYLNNEHSKSKSSSN